MISHYIRRSSFFHIQSLMSNSRYFTLTCSVLLVLGLSISIQAADLAGQWTFEDGEEMLDLAVKFGDLQIKDATVEDGQRRIR